MVICLSMGVFYLSYRFNNKYAARCEQPIHGVLCADDEMAAEKIYYLAREWQYYPDVLLTPGMLLKNSYYSRYISIREYGGMEMGNKNASPYGCGTYRMLIMLPQEKQNWSIFLPEVFSAYRIYINGDLAGQVGDPDEDFYRDAVLNRMYTFRASGTVEILIAVADQNGVSSGIQRVPVFGAPLKLNMERGVQVLINGFVMAVCMCILLCSFLVFLKDRSGEFGIFVLVCACVIGYSSYPMTHSFFLLPVQPWYGLETFCYYLMLPCMIWLEDRIWEKRTGRYLVAVLAVWAAAAFALELLCGRLGSAGILYLASWISEGMKWLAALYLIIRGIKDPGKKYGRTVLAGTVVYGCSLGADRLWPVYEPVVGGWFPEIGGLFMMGAFGSILFREIADAYRLKLVYEVYSRQTELRLMAQKNHYEKLKEQMEETNRVRHDMRQHLRLIASLLENQKYEEIREYLAKYTVEFQTRLYYRCFCANTVVDSILHYYEEVCRQKNIDFRCEAEIPLDTGVEDTDFCRLFGNLMENGVEAAGKCTKNRRFLSVKTWVKGNKLLIRIENSSIGTLERSGKRLLSGKHEGKGIGTFSASEIAEKYGGLADFSQEGDVFLAEVFLRIQKKDTGDKLCV